MKLTPRLQTIANMVDKGSIIGDIGTDHAYLPVWLVENSICERAFATDINEGPLANAVGTIEEAGFSDQITTRLGGGIEPYHLGEANAYVIAGMGGMLIIDILTTSKELADSADYLILQPMQGRADLRKWLSENAYEILEERIAIEGEKFYEIIKVKAGKGTQMTWAETELGTNMLQDENYYEFLDHKIRVHERILAGVKKGNDQAAISRVEAELKAIEEVKSCALTQKR